MHLTWLRAMTGIPMNEQELHQVAMCAAQTFADMMLERAREGDCLRPCDEFGRAVAKAYAAARDELIRSPGAVVRQPVMMSEEQYARFFKANGSGG